MIFVNRKRHYKYYLLLFTMVAVACAVYGIFGCAASTAACSQPTVAETVPAAPLALGHCSAHCLHRTILPLAVPAIPAVVVILALPVALRLVRIHQIGFPPLTPPPRA
jgi:hypothetical protein